MTTERMLLLGCVADDFTGASDAASFLVRSGIPTMLFNGIPKNTGSLNRCAAAVITLKTRSIAAGEAVAASKEAFRFLQEQGAVQLYSKYCSTFDSTPKGNIGPITDAMLEELKLPYTLLCPSLPVNKRTVRSGHLYVDGVPLHESSMKNHPLNPMWDSFIPALMKEQGKYPCLVLNGQDLENRELVHQKIAEMSRNNDHFYIVPDYETEEQGRRIIELFGENRLFTGGSGILAHIADRYKEKYGQFKDLSLDSGTSGKAILLAGSCSKATREQVQNYIAGGGAAIEINPGKLLNGKQQPEEIWNFIDSHIDPLVYSSGAGGMISGADDADPEKASAIIEKTMAAIGKQAYEQGYRRLIIAGGETSGAVMLALGLDSFFIGESIAPGVPIMIPANNQEVRLALKSGNFGQLDFFKRALEMTRGQ